MQLGRDGEFSLLGKHGFDLRGMYLRCFVAQRYLLEPPGILFHPCIISHILPSAEVFVSERTAWLKTDDQGDMHKVY